MSCVLQYLYAIHPELQEMKMLQDLIGFWCIKIKNTNEKFNEDVRQAVGHMLEVKRRMGCRHKWSTVPLDYRTAFSLWRCNVGSVALNFQLRLLCMIIGNPQGSLIFDHTPTYDGLNNNKYPHSI